MASALVQVATGALGILLLVMLGIGLGEMVHFALSPDEWPAPLCEDDE